MAELPNGGTHWRLSELERRVRDLEQQKVDAKLGVIDERVTNCHRAIDSLRKDTHDDFTELHGDFVNLKRVALSLLVSLLVGAALLIAGGIPGA